MRMMKQLILKIKLKVCTSKDKKKLSDGRLVVYEYGTISIRNTKLTKYIGDGVEVYVLGPKRIRHHL